MLFLDHEVNNVEKDISASKIGKIKFQRLPHRKWMLIIMMKIQWLLVQFYDPKHGQCTE